MQTVGSYCGKRTGINRVKAYAARTGVAIAASGIVIPQIVPAQCLGLPVNKSFGQHLRTGSYCGVVRVAVAASNE